MLLPGDLEVSLIKDASALLDITLMGICHHTLKRRNQTKDEAQVILMAPISSVKVAPTLILVSH